MEVGGGATTETPKRRIDAQHDQAPVNRGFWQCVGWGGVGSALVFGVVGAILVYSGCNGFQLYAFSRKNVSEWEKKKVDTWRSAGFDATGLQAEFEYLLDRPRSDFDFENSDNYKYARLVQWYDYENAETLVGACVYLALGTISLKVAYDATFGWRRFYFGEKRRGIPGWVPGRVATLARIAVEAAGEDRVEVGMIVLAIGLSYLFGFQSGPSAVFGFAASLVVVGMYVLGTRSELVQIIVFESLEVGLQTYQVLRWSGLDPIELWLKGRHSQEYQELVVDIAVVGDRGRAVVGLTWLLVINCVLTSLLLATPSLELHHSLCDALLELAYTLWSMFVSLSSSQRQARVVGRELPVALA